MPNLNFHARSAMPSRQWLASVDAYLTEGTARLLQDPSDEELATVLVMFKRYADQQRAALSLN